MTYEEKLLLFLYRKADERARYDAIRLLETHRVEQGKQSGIIIDMPTDNKKAEE